MESMPEAGMSFAHAPVAEWRSAESWCCEWLAHSRSMPPAGYPSQRSFSEDELMPPQL